MTPQTAASAPLLLNAPLPISPDPVTALAPLSRAALDRLAEIEAEPRGGYSGHAHTITNADRRARFAAQRQTQGFDDSELWNLDLTLTAFLAPRLRRFAEITQSHPVDVSHEEWRDELAELADGLDALRSDSDDPETLRLRERACEILGARLRHLWS
jgi:hypothetical protein